MLGMRQLSLRAVPFCTSPFVWLFVASFVASWVPCEAAAVEVPEPDVLRLRAKMMRPSAPVAAVRRQSAIYRYSYSSALLLPKASNSIEVANVESNPEHSEADESIEKNWPAGTVILLGLGSLLLPLLPCLICTRPANRKSDTIPLHGYAPVPRSEVIGHESLAHSALTTSHQPFDQRLGETPPETQFFYIGDAHEESHGASISGYNSEALPTESEPEAELCPDAPMPVSQKVPEKEKLQADVEEVVVPKVMQPVFLPVDPPLLPELYVQPSEEALLSREVSRDSRCRLLMLYASPLCRLDARGPTPLPGLGFEKEWKSVLKASAEVQGGPSTFAARPLTSGAKFFWGSEVLQLHVSTRQSSTEKITFFLIIVFTGILRLETKAWDLKNQMNVQSFIEFLGLHFSAALTKPPSDGIFKLQSVKLFFTVWQKGSLPKSSLRCFCSFFVSVPIISCP